MKTSRTASCLSRLLCTGAVALAAFAPAPAAQAADSKGLYQTLYYISCETYTKDRKDPPNSGMNAIDKIYVSGWLSGYNYLTPNTFDILPNHNVDTVMQWLDDYCAKNPQSSVEAGLLQLTDELYPQRIQNMPQPDPKAGMKFDDMHFHIQDK